MTHERIHCAIKLKALIEKLDKLGEVEPPMLSHAIEDCRALARELRYESEFISGLE
jgi:hypothetical protein|tara:strand:- start:19072 stop:19239 length:168 start_codon:yes stop_codon:yes gene_type:complete